MAEQTSNEGEFQDPLEDYEPRQYDDSLEAALVDKSITEIQAQPYITVTADTSIREALDKLVGDDIACLMVEEDGKLVGVFGDRDVLDKVALELDSIRDRPIREVMKPNPIYVYESDAPGAALAVMAVTGHRHVPLVSLDETIKGIISPQRVVRFLRENSTE